MSEEIINQKATAELWKNQTDEEEIGMKYEIIDQILLAKEMAFQKEEIAQKLNIEIDQIEMIERLVKNNDFKTKLAPTVIF